MCPFPWGCPMPETKFIATSSSALSGFLRDWEVCCGGSSGCDLGGGPPKYERNAAKVRRLA